MIIVSSHFSEQNSCANERLVEVMIPSAGYNEIEEAKRRAAKAYGKNKHLDHRERRLSK